MSLPAGVVLASKTSLSLSQWSSSAWCSILGVYSGKVRWSGGIQYHLQHIEVYVLVVIHTYTILQKDPFVKANIQSMYCTI